jgi:hypothetical protein
MGTNITRDSVVMSACMSYEVIQLDHKNPSFYSFFSTYVPVIHKVYKQKEDRNGDE